MLGKSGLSSFRVVARGTATCCRTSLGGSYASLLCSVRTLKNLHQYPHARHKSLVKDHIRFARNWWLSAGNNYELVHDVGHEREASENFGEYRDDSNKDRFRLSTSRLEDLPPNIRLNALTALMRERWKVKDGNRGFDKAKMMLQALECFSEMRLANMLKPFEELPEPDQDTFLQYVESCSQFAQACVHSHPDALAILIRAAEICDEMRCQDKRDEMLEVAQRACDNVDKSYHFARPKENTAPRAGAPPSSKPFLSTLQPPSRTEMEAERWIKEKKRMQERFRDKPWVLEKKDKFVGRIITARNRTVHLVPMKESDPRRRLLAEPPRPETEGWSRSH